MSISPLRKVRSDDDTIRQLQGAVDLVFQELLKKQLIDGNFFEDVELTMGIVNLVPHKLGKEAQGYIVVKRDANATIWDSESTNEMKNSFLNLRTSADCVISLWVF